MAISAALCASMVAGRADDEPIPNLGDRTKDGFVVRCYWTGSYQFTRHDGHQGSRGTFGVLMTPLSKTQITTARFIYTEELDEHGKMRLTPRAGNWSSKMTRLNYWDADGNHSPGGKGGSKEGEIAAEDLTLSVTENEGHAIVECSINNRPDRYAFDYEYNPLTTPKGGSAFEVIVGPKTETRPARADFEPFHKLEQKLLPRKSVFRQEIGRAEGSYYGRWIITRICETADVHLVYPKGTQQQYTFNSNNPGVLYVLFKATVTPGGPDMLEKVKDRVRFKMEGIGDSKMEWDPTTPDGKPIVETGFLQAKLKFTGLPAKNDDFGKKKVQLLVDGKPIESASVKVFFPKLAANHPGGKSNDPNWFYYWKEGDVCGIAANDIYVEREGYYGYSEPSVDSYVRLCQAAPMAGDGPQTFDSNSAFGSVTVRGQGRGIKCVAEILEHERHHIAIYTLHSRHDTDGDHVPDEMEAYLDDLKSDPNDPDTFNVHYSFDKESGYSGYGDDEVRCRKKELSLSVPYHPEKDWADPGCQTTTPYGP